MKNWNKIWGLWNFLSTQYTHFLCWALFAPTTSEKILKMIWSIIRYLTTYFTNFIGKFEKLWSSWKSEEWVCRYRTWVCNFPHFVWSLCSRHISQIILQHSKTKPRYPIDDGFFIKIKYKEFSSFLFWRDFFSIKIYLRIWWIFFNVTVAAYVVVTFVSIHM